MARRQRYFDGLSSCFLKQREPRKGITEGAGHVQIIADVGAASKKCPASWYGTDQRYADEPVCRGCGGVSADKVDVMGATGIHEAAVKLVNLTAGAGSWNCNGDQQIARSASHGCDIA